MKRLSLFLFLFSIILCASYAQKREKENSLLIGYATSLKDSVVYLTTAQSIRLAKVKSEKEARDPYTTQWQSYISSLGTVRGAICVLFQVGNEKEADKTLVRLKRNAYKDGVLRIVEVQPSEFSFSQIPLENLIPSQTK